MAKTCRGCGGSGETRCEHCRGSGRITCTQCSGRGYVSEGTGRKAVESTCTRCGGDGGWDCEKYITCDMCLGSGEVS